MLRSVFPPVSRHLVRTLGAVLVLAVVSSLGCSSNDLSAPGSAPSDPATETFASSLGVNLDQMTKLADGLYVQDITVGTGAQAVVNSEIRVRYTGWLRTGVKFDGNAPSGNPLQFTLGVREVIEGWDIGVDGMRVGGKRRLVFSSRYGYGAAGSGPIPPNASLVFDVELISIVN